MAIVIAAVLAGIAVSVALVLASGAPDGAGPPGSAEAPASVEPSAPAAPTTSTSPEPPPPSPEPTPDVTFTLVAGGDILTHGPVLDSAQRQGDGAYDFAPLMANVRPYVDGADLALCHLEVPVAPAGTQPSGYPVFGAPVELITAIDAEGWDGCSVASNHSVDRGFAGLEATLDAMDDVRLGHTGTARTEAEAASTQMYTVREGGRTVSVAQVSFTYGLNGLPKPDGKPWAVDTFDADAADVQPILDAAQAARDDGADVVVASVHCCVEYRVAPSPAQQSIVDQIGASGLVDLYIGHHAHVPQPIQLVDGGPSGQGMWAATGHGNYLSNQDTQCCVADANSGYVTTSTITVDPEGAVDVSVEWTAVTVDRLDNHTMHVLRNILDTGAGNLSASEAQARWRRVADAVGDQAPERASAPQPLADAAYSDLRWWHAGM
ncbi:hypothetical protein Dac01nite_10010 [Demequina activiva]|uniref:Capsule synthesis protein CapA domain-containing protein n=2 Tax=Demequina activiva TaxID=1582364 RepID=A0A919UGA4_9MICO|nr:hypothetical protein Dac01nite_10010 [Demequina activiva]